MACHKLVDIDGLAGFLDPRGAGRRHLRLAGGADHAKPAKRLLQPVGQSFIGHFLVREQRVAADRRQLDGLQHRRHRRQLLIAGVGVPDTAEIHRLMLAFQHRGDFGNAVDTVKKRIDVRIAERLGEAKLLLRGQVLAAKHHHIVLQPDGPDLADQIVGKIARAEIDAGDLGPHGWRQFRNFHANHSIRWPVGPSYVPKTLSRRPVTTQPAAAGGDIWCQ